MSAPLARDEEIDDAFRYAPPWARQQSPRARPVEEAPSTSADDQHSPLSRGRAADPDPEPRMATGMGGPNIELPPRMREGTPFEGDVAMVELRRRLSLQPELVPDPPIWIRPESPSRRIMRLSFVLLISFVAAYGLAVLYPSSFNPLAFMPINIPEPAPEAAEAKAQIETPARLVIEGRRAFANEPLPLGLSLIGASGEEFVLLRGLSAGTRLSAGTPLAAKGWRVPAREIASVTAFAPKDYIGTMEAAVDLHAGDRLVDSQVLRLEWVENKPVRSARLQPQQQAAAPAPAMLTLDQAEIALMIKRGQELLRNGHISSARLMLHRAAKAGSADAALALASTYDPVVLAEMGVLGFAPDAEQARAWYSKASELGSSEATRRLEQMTTTARR
jgi:hypothetical protein